MKFSSSSTPKPTSKSTAASGANLKSKPASTSNSSSSLRSSPVAKPSTYHWSFVDFAAQLADLKDERYRELLALSTVIELLVDKGILTPEEIRVKAAEMEAEIDRYLP